MPGGGTPPPFPVSLRTCWTSEGIGWSRSGNIKYGSEPILLSDRVPSHQGKKGKRKMMKKNSLQGKIREFVKKEKIREKSGNFIRETKKYFVKENTSV
jgi:hypothetical protein